MNTNWTPLWSDILSSSLWNLGSPGEPEEERERGKNAKLLFMTMIPMANQEGWISASLGGLAHQARLTSEETLKALEILEGPDPESRCQDKEGRRVEKVEGGWHIIGYSRHWERMQVERRKAQLRIAQAKHRFKTVGKAEVNNKEDLVRVHKAHIKELEKEIEDETREK